MIDAIRDLHSSRTGLPEVRLRVAVEKIEQLCHILDIDPRDWPKAVVQWFGHMYAVTDFRSYLTRLAMNAMSAASWSGRPHPGSREIVHWRHNGPPVDLALMAERIDEVVDWPPPNSSTAVLLLQAKQLLESPKRLCKALLGRCQ